MFCCCCCCETEKFEKILYLSTKSFVYLFIKTNRIINILFHLGCVAGFFQAFICGPLELIKIRLQMQNIGLESQTIFSDSKKLTPWSCVRNILRQEGIKGLCCGLGSTFLREVPSFGVYFATYDSLCKLELKEGQRIDEVGLFNVLQI